MMDDAIKCGVIHRAGLVTVEPTFARAPTPELIFLAEGLEFPEGPVAFEDGSLIVTEIKGGRLTHIAADGTKSTIAELGGGPNGAAIGPDGACYVTNNGGHRWASNDWGPIPAGMREDYQGGSIQRVDVQTGRFETLYTRHANGPLTSPNDLVFDASGGFWFTDLGKRRGRQQHIGSVCYAKADGSAITEVIAPLVTPNGIGLSPDGRTLYVSETATGRVWMFRISSPGKIDKRPWPSPHGGHLLCNVGGYRTLDSLAVDAEGNVHAAALIDSGIATITPEGTSIVHTSFPDIYTTNICFGGPELRTAFVTLTQTGRVASFKSATAGLKLNFHC